MKKEVRDIVTNKSSERTIRNIPIPGKEPSKKEDRRERGSTSIPVRKIITPEENNITDYSFTEKNRNRNWKIWAVAFVALVVLFLIGSALFNKTTITIETKQIPFDMTGKINAGKNGEGILYTSITLKDKTEIQVKGGEKKEISEKASGKIVIYNNSGTASQKLVAGTRFETPEGLIFKTDRAVTVPGQTTKDGKKIPGSVEATIFAEKAGNQYNVGLTDFTIPGFKGTDKFNSVYARSKTAIGGGGLGTIAVVKEEDLKKANGQIEESLKQILIKKIKEETPKNFIVPENAWTITVEVLPPDYNSEGATIKAEGSIKAFTLNVGSIYSFYSSRDKMPVGEGNVKASSLNLKATSFSETDNGLEIDLTGTVTVTADIDKDKVLSSVIGKGKSEALEPIKKIAAVNNAKITVTPFWSSKVSDSPSDIEINIK